MMEILWEKLLCKDTLKEKEETPKSWTDYPIDPFEQDYREIISSLSFRHLQDKAQVYQLVKGDFVRTRLTHSLEVSTIGKQLGIMLIDNKKTDSSLGLDKISPELAKKLPMVLACAGLLHDMGNPPYGHEAEESIGEWFKKSFESDDFTFFGKPVRELFTEHMKKDLVCFEGNAQVIRMLAQCRHLLTGQEANVTLATISALIKYPVSSLEMDKNNPDLRLHKFGYYLTEEKIVKEIREKTGINIPGCPYARNPLTYLLEAADDIAYITSDVEDAIEKGTITLPQMISIAEKKIKELPEEGDEEHQMQVITATGIFHILKKRLKQTDGSKNAEIAAFQNWTNYVRNWLMYVTAGSFVKNSKEIMNGTYSDDLLMKGQHKYTVQILKRIMYENVYPELDYMHITACNVVNFLTEKFSKAVLYWDTSKKPDGVERAYIHLIDQKYKDVYFKEKTDDEVFNLYLRFRMIFDFLTGMTDGYAMDLYKKLTAMTF